MPSVPVGYVRFNHVLRLTGDQQDILVTLAFNSTVIAQGDIQGVCNSVFTAYKNGWGGLPSAYQLNRVDGYWGNGLVGSSNAAPFQFTGSMSALPQNCAYLIKKITGVGGRRNRGRMYVPGVPENVVDAAGNLLAAEIDAIQGMLGTWFTALQAITALGDPVILHNNSSTPTPITSFQCDPRIATQRRRMR